MKKLTVLLILILILSGCEKKEDAPVESNVSTSEEALEEILDNSDEKEPEEAEELPQILVFKDAKGNTYETEINPDVSANPYEREGFKQEGDRVSFDGTEYYSRFGIDVSEHQGRIDWTKVKNSGVEFAFLRIGYRGYGKAGNLVADKTFENNYWGAKNAGIDVGIYFFAQAVNEEEAAEEAEFVLSLLGDKAIDLSIVYDPESILGANARTDGVSGEQFTRNSIVFCERIIEAGHRPMIYANMKWEAFMLDLTKLPYPLWYADYEPIPQTPYDFSFWQYSESGSVDGIAGACDLNLEFIRKQL